MMKCVKGPAQDRHLYILVEFDVLLSSFPRGGKAEGEGSRVVGWGQCREGWK